MLSLFSVNLVQAQILNVEQIRRRRDDTTRHVVSNVSLRLRLNNRTAAASDPVNFFSTNLQANIAYNTPEHSYLLLNRFDYLLINNQSFISTGYHHIRTNFLRHQRLSYELFAQAQYEPPRGLRERFIGGGGVRLRLWEKERTACFIGIGGMIERELWRDPTEQELDREVVLWKASNYMSFRWQDEQNIQFNIIAYYQTGYDYLTSFFRHRINTDANLNIRLSEHLDFQVSFSGAYENQPIVPITKFVYSLSNGLMLRF